MKRHAMFIVALGSAVFGCSSSDTAPAPTDPADPTPDPAAVVSYYKDVKPILDLNCVGCHQPGQIGIGTLSDYAKVSAGAVYILQQMEDRVMPPWLAADGCNDYHDNPSLPAEDIATFAKWIEAGLLEGDPAEDPGVTAPSLKQLDRVDLTISLPSPYIPNADTPDDYRCFLVDWPTATASYVTGFGVRPGNTSTVHHLIAYVAPPSSVAEYEALDAADPKMGYTCYGGPGGTQDGNVSFFAAWAPGGQDTYFPAGTGIAIEPGSKVIVQMHYNTITWDGEPDQTSVVVKTESVVDKPGKFAFFTGIPWVINGTMNIPAGDADVVHAIDDDLSWLISDSKPFTIHGGAVHMHTRGTKIRLGHKPAGSGQDNCLIDIPRWDFDWQVGYWLTETVSYVPGDTLTLECHWDNSASNQPWIDGQQMAPEDLNWGEGTNDEMCLATIFVTVDG
ncbi:hypothetical protein JYT28_00770 [Desulfobulbus sp. AH-315-M07]|nr:hypothetical protein [Desulfobulbus sp. AH-315-M07]